MALSKRSRPDMHLSSSAYRHLARISRESFSHDASMIALVTSMRNQSWSAIAHILPGMLVPAPRFNRRDYRLQTMPQCPRDSDLSLVLCTHCERAVSSTLFLSHLEACVPSVAKQIEFETLEESGNLGSHSRMSRIRQFSTVAFGRPHAHDSSSLNLHFSRKLRFPCVPRNGFTFQRRVVRSRTGIREIMLQQTSIPTGQIPPHLVESICDTNATGASSRTIPMPNFGGSIRTEPPSISIQRAAVMRAARLHNHQLQQGRLPSAPSQIDSAQIPMSRVPKASSRPAASATRQSPPNSPSHVEKSGTAASDVTLNSPMHSLQQKISAMTRMTSVDSITSSDVNGQSSYAPSTISVATTQRTATTAHRKRVSPPDCLTGVRFPDALPTQASGTSMNQNSLRFNNSVEPSPTRSSDLKQSSIVANVSFPDLSSELSRAPSVLVDNSQSQASFGSEANQRKMDKSAAKRLHHFMLSGDLNTLNLGNPPLPHRGGSTKP